MQFFGNGFKPYFRAEFFFNVNANGYTELDDVVHLARYLAGWDDVKLN